MKQIKIDVLCNKIPKETLYELYIIQNIPFKDLFEKLSITRKDLRRLLTKYGIKKSYTQRAKNNHYKRPPEVAKEVGLKSSKTQKENWEKKSAEEKDLWREKQKIAHSTDSFRKNISIINKEYRKNLKENNPEKDAELNQRRKNSAKIAWLNPDVKLKKHQTEERNRIIQTHKLCRTIAEQVVYDELKLHYQDLRYDVKVDDRYPYFCDFYIPSLDLFIELNAHPSHGRLPYSMMKYDEYSKLPQKWIDVYARRDVEKFKKSKESNINYIRIYPQASIYDNYKINEDKYKEIIDICYRAYYKSRHNVANYD